MFTKSPGFALTAVLSLALGTGANTAIFSLVDIVMLRTLPVHEPRQLVELGRRDGDTLSYPIYEIIRARNEAFSGVLLLSAGRYTASARLGALDAGDVRLSPVSGDYFAVLGVAPSIGRVLKEDDLPASNTAVITDDLWQRAFARDPAIVGQAMQLGDRHLHDRRRRSARLHRRVHGTARRCLRADHAPARSIAEEFRGDDVPRRSRG